MLGSALLLAAAAAPANAQLLAAKDGIAFNRGTKDSIAFVMAPDDVKVELLEVQSQSAPMALHHAHYFTQQVDAMKA